MDEPLFSILIPTWNNFPYLKICLSSIRKNSTFHHQILLYINDGSDGTLEWVIKNNIEYIHNSENVGVCMALNALRSKVKTDYILFLNDDMYLCPGWDTALWEEISKTSDKYFFFSSTLLQPNSFFDKSIISNANYGETPETFNEEKLLKEYNTYQHDDWFGATWPPNIVHKDLWDLVGGYSIEFSPGMYSDPDFTAKLYLAGVRLFKGISKSRSYHFVAVSTKRLKKNNGSMQFLFKWGMTSSTFMKYIVRRGKPFNENEINNVDAIKLKNNILRSRLKLFAYNLVKRKNNFPNLYQ